MMIVIGLVLLFVVAVVVSVLARDRSPRPAEPAHKRRVSVSMQPEPHPRSPNGIVQPRSHERVTPHQLTFTRPTGLTPELVDSDKDQGVQYEVDVSQVTCTCPDFQRRANRPKASFSRCCKHLVRMLSECGHLESADEWVQAIAADGYGAPAEAWMVELNTAPAVLVAVAPSREWVNVYARKPRSGERIKTASGPIERYGWNVEEDRWSYGEGPPGSRELTPLMKLVL
jgi:hypothetical protein